MEKRKAVVVGCGGISAAWMNAMADFDDVEIVGLCDLREENIATFRERWGVQPRSMGADLSTVLRESDADTVFDCTVPEAHASVAVTAMEAGCDVLGEKPMAPTMEQARSMVAAARKTGKTYAVIQNRRYLSSIRRFRKTIEESKIGDLTTLNVDFYIGAHFDGFRAEMAHVLLVDMAIHTFDQARYISGTDPVRVTAVDWNPSGSWYRDGASAVAIFEMTGGVRFVYRGSWCSEGVNTSWEGDWRAICREGTLRWDGGENVWGERAAEGDGLIRTFAAMDVPPDEPLAHTGHAGVIREFLDSLRAGKKPMTDCTDNIKSIAMVLSAVESAERGCTVDVSTEK